MSDQALRIHGLGHLNEPANIGAAEVVADWDALSWAEVLPKSSLDAGSHNFFNIANTNVFTHVRLHIYPDGGVSRLRVYGTFE